MYSMCKHTSHLCYIQDVHFKSTYFPIFLLQYYKKTGEIKIPFTSSTEEEGEIHALYMQICTYMYTCTCMCIIYNVQYSYVFCIVNYRYCTFIIFSHCLEKIHLKQMIIIVRYFTIIIIHVASS